MNPNPPSHPQIDPQALGEHGGHVIYAMPMFLRLAAGDPLRTLDFFTRALDFDVMFRGPDAGGVPVLVHLRRSKYQDVLVMPSRQAVQPAMALSVSFTVADADALDALAERIRRHASRPSTRLSSSCAGSPRAARSAQATPRSGTNRDIDVVF